MATWPTQGDLDMWIGETPPEASPIIAGCLDAARDIIANHTTYAYDATEIAPAVRQACLMVAHRLYRRQQSPEGTVAFGDGAAIRLYTVDADVRALIGPYCNFGIAG